MNSNRNGNTEKLKMEINYDLRKKVKIHTK